MKKAGIDRLKDIGELNTVFDLCEQFPAYKFDDILDMEYKVVFLLQLRNVINADIKYNLSEPDK